MKLQVKIEDQVYEVEVGDLNSQPVIASVDGERFEVWPEELQAAAPAAPAVKPAPAAAPAPAPAPAPAVKPAAAPASGAKSLTAPIPGVINAVKVKAGDQVKAGDELFMLEAMKMNNAIRAPKAGTVASVYVSVGEQVKHGQPLMDYAD